MFPDIYYSLVLTISALLFFIIHYNWKRRYLYLAASRLKGPFAWPIIGNGTAFICKNEEILMTFYNIVKQYDLGPCKFWLGPKLLIGFMNPDHVEKILSSPKFSHKHDIYDFMKVFFGEGLITGSGPQYKQHRKIIQPIFDLNFAKECIPIFQKHIDVCMNKLEDYVDKGNFNFDSIVHKCMIDMMKEIMLGSNERCQINGLSDFDQAMIEFYNLGFLRMAKPHLHPNFIYNLTPNKKRQDELQRIIRTQGESVLKAARERRKLQIATNDLYIVVDRLMDYMENNPGVFSDEVLYDHLLTIYAASEDPSAIISAFIAVCFGMYPEYQEKAASEIRDIFGEKARSVTADDIIKLNYVNMCIKDVLRIFPIAPVILRKCNEDYQLGKWLIPKGCAIFIPIFNVHRDERFWENPEHFHPDHFLPEAENKRHAYAYVPFSAGPRGCIGKILAHVALKVFICNLLQRFEIQADGKVPDIELKMDISTRPKHGYFLGLKKRVWK